MYVFLVCLLVSMIIWLLIKLSGEFFSDITYPVTFRATPENYILTGAQDSMLSLNVKMTGFALIATKYFSDKSPVELDLEDLTFNPSGADTVQVKYGTDVLAGEIADELNIEKELVSVWPDTLVFQFQKFAKKKVKIIPHLVFELKKQFQLSRSIKIQPDSVEVSGPKGIISRMETVRTKKIDLGVIDETHVIDASLKPSSNSNISYSEKKVSVTIPVEKFTEASVELDIIIDKDNRDIAVKIFPEKVTVYYLVSLNDFNRVDPEMFRAEVNYQTNMELFTRKLKVEIVNKPDFVRINKIKPQKVEYIIIK